MSILRTIAGVERRAATPTNGASDWGAGAVIPTNGQLGYTMAGVQVSESTAMSLATVFTSVAIVSDSISSLPLKVYERTTDGVNVPVARTPALIDCPWPGSTRQDWLGQVLVSLLLRGNAYGIICARDSLGYPSAIQLIHPDAMQCRMVAGQVEYRLSNRVVDPEMIFHVPAMASPGSGIGMDPISYMRSSLGGAIAAERYGNSFFQNSAQPSGVLETSEDLSPRETLELARAWRSAHQGVSSAQMPAVLTGGVQFKSISLSPEAAQFLETRKFSAEEIAAFFRVPRHLALGGDDKTANVVGLEAIELQFVTYCLGPWMNRIENKMNTYLPVGQVCKFDLSERVRAPSLERYQRYTLARNSGILSVNEIRAAENLPPLAADQCGDDHWSPLNFAPMGSPVFQDPALSSGGIGGGMDQSPAKGNSDAMNNGQ